MSVRRLAIVDPHGTERLVLTADSKEVQVDGKTYPRRSPAAGLILQNAKGNEIGGIAMLDDGTASIMFDSHTGLGSHERVGLFVLPDGRSGVLSNDPAGKLRAHMEVDPQLNAVFALADGNGDSRIAAKVTPAGETTWSNSGASSSKPSADGR
jgi:hypothetical protein